MTLLGFTLKLFWVYSILLFSDIASVNCQELLNTIDDNLPKELICLNYEVCGACMTAPADCRWCADPYFNKNQPRCNSYDQLVALGCSQDLIQRQPDEVNEVIEDNKLQDMELGSKEPVVQIQPQKVQLSLKPHQVKKVKFQYRPAKNYPLDLYYLMDLTWTMKDDKETLVSLRDDLPMMLKNLTSNFRLGFGSFADKPVSPFINTDEYRLANPCAVEGEVCERTYSFHHRLSLTNEVNQFIDKVNRSTVTANLDNAEAQLEALMQVLVCGDAIGWTKESRKIVLILTDGILHTAGDGKLGGAVRRNDEQCHLDNNGYYSESGTYDYPSIAQIYKLLEYYKVNVIFAVTEDLIEYYGKLQATLDKFTYIDKIEYDSSNILKLVKKGYEEIVSEVNFKDDAGIGPLKIKYFSDCGVKGAPLIETSTCELVKFGMVLNFEAHIGLDYCSEYSKMNRTIKIVESHLGQDSLTVNIDLECGCDCEQKMNVYRSACYPNSRLVCGVCQCNKGWAGPTCNCSVGDEAASAPLIGQCRDPKHNTMLCHGKGDCDCGKCSCDDGFSGKYCQCGPCKVDIEKGECGGIERGQCSCGKCLCNPGWTGSACECSILTDKCKAPGSNLICSGRGECNCGQCVCTPSPSGSRVSSGAYCEMCPSCNNSLCSNAMMSILCDTEQDCYNGSYTNAFTNYTFNLVKTLNETENTNEPQCVQRQDENEQSCEYRYTYSVVKENTVNVVLYSKRCSQTNMAMFLNGGPLIILAIIIIGLICITFYKMWQIRTDRIAYENFQKEADRSMLDPRNEKNENPLYISPISEFKLPESFQRDKND